MYRYSNGQISLADFKQPVGMNLKESNRWVKKAQTIPWPEIEKRCAALFTNRKGNVAKPLRLALGACIIQAEYGYSDEETALQIQENPYLQYFRGYGIVCVTSLGGINQGSYGIGASLYCIGTARHRTCNYIYQ